MQLQHTSFHPIELKVLDERIRPWLPQYATPGSAAVDLRVCLPAFVPDYTLGPGCEDTFHTGIAIHISDPGFAAIIVPRSGLGTKGIVIRNTVGLIDSDYQGELMVGLMNRGKERFSINNFDRIAQLFIVPVVQAHFQEVEEFSVGTTERGSGGFGSTGVK